MPTGTSRLHRVDIDRAHSIGIADVAMERGLVLKKTGRELVGPCPHCNGVDRFAINITDNVWNCRGCSGKGRGAVAFVHWLDGCDFYSAVETLIGQRHASTRDKPTAAANKSQDRSRRQHDKARWLWSQGQPITGSIAESYLRTARGITCPLPRTLGFLAPRKPDQKPAMIAAFGVCDEVEPGLIIAPREVIAVHLTLLKSDGSGKADVSPNKLMIGSPNGLPIVLAPPNDLLGLAVTEGIEDALTRHQVLGLGAWAAGSAPHMGQLGDAVPDWIDCVSVFADADQQGRRNSALLADHLNVRGIFAEVLPSAETQS